MPKQNWKQIEEEFIKEFESNDIYMPEAIKTRDVLSFFKQKFQQNLHNEAIGELEYPAYVEKPELLSHDDSYLENKPKPKDKSVSELETVDN